MTKSSTKDRKSDSLENMRHPIKILLQNKSLYQNEAN
jgi:hypothetical protein